MIFQYFFFFFFKQKTAYEVPLRLVGSVGLWAKYRKLALTAPALLIRGKVQTAEGAATVVADHLQLMDLRVRSKSRDFK